MAAVPVITACVVVTLCCASSSALALVRAVAPQPVGDILQLLADLAGVASFAGGVGASVLSRCVAYTTATLRNYVSIRDFVARVWFSFHNGRALIGASSFVSAFGNVPFNPFLNVSSSSSVGPLVFTSVATVASHASVAFAPSVYASFRSGVLLADVRSLAAVVVGHAVKAASVSPAAALAGLVLLIVVSGVLRAWSDGE
jgi:hypothetical protein